MSDGPRVGFEIDHLRLEELLGQGGMGEVYLARDLVLDRLVAVKTLRADRRLSAHDKARLLREARLLSKLGDPGICQIFGVIEKPEADYLVLEHVRGRTLGRARDLGYEEKLAVMAKIARALAAAHRAGIVHRDLKADNVMVTPDGEVKILDFGIARSVDAALPDAGEDGGDDEPGPATGSTDELTQRGTVIGTFGTMSPEQARGEEITEASDLYSLGVVFQELVTGRSAYGRASGLALWQRAGRGETEPAEDLDPDLATLLRELLSVDPRRRPGAELVAARLGWIADKPVRERAQRKRRRLIAASFVALAIGLAVTAWLAVAARRARDEAERRRELAQELIGFMLGDLRPKLEELGRLDILDAVGDRSLAYFAALPAGQLSPDERLSRLHGIVQIADVRRLQGDLEASLAALETADLESDETTGASPAPEIVEARGALLGLRGQLQLDLGDLDGAVATWEEAVRLAERGLAARPDNERVSSQAAIAWHNVGTAYDAAGDAAKSVAAWRRSLELQDRAPDAAGETEVGLRAATMAYLSRSLEQEGDLAAALELRRRYLDHLERAAARAPDNAERSFDLAVGRGFLAGLENALGEPAPAEDRLRAAVAGMDARAAGDPTNADVRFWQMNLRLTLAGVLVHHGGAREALPILDQVDELTRDDGEDGPEAANPWIPGSSRLLRALAYEKLGDPRAAATAEAARAATGRFHDSPSDRNRHAVAELVVGRLAEAANRTADAEAAWARAAEVLAGEERPLRSWQLLETEVEVLARQGRLAEAEASLRALEAMGWRGPRQAELRALVITVDR